MYMYMYMYPGRVGMHMSMRLWLVGWWIGCAIGFGTLSLGSYEREKHILSAAETCHETLGHTLGVAFFSCVVHTLLERQAAAKAAGSFKYYALGEDELQRLLPGTYGSARADELMNTLRNYSCEVDDGGSKPVRSFDWTYEPADPCASKDGADGLAARPPTTEELFVYAPGFLPAGNDLRSAHMTEAEAKAACASDADCAGLTFQAEEESRSDTSQRHNMLFKRSAEGQTGTTGWHTWRKLHVLNCSLERRRLRSAPMTLRVNVLRESPPVYVVDDFVSDSECDRMLAETVPKMGRSVVGGGGTSNWRRSYSVNMVPDFEDEDHLVTRIARRKFAFAREVVGYEGVIEGVGQEPINAVYYHHDGDQYRPHCDGECRGGKYTMGSRVASSLAYCSVADKGGYTLFTRVGLKVVPRRRQMLFFGYFFNGTVSPGVRMDDGHTEHTGCPTHAGSKWIATMCAPVLAPPCSPPPPLCALAGTRPAMLMVRAVRAVRPSQVVPRGSDGRKRLGVLVKVWPRRGVTTSPMSICPCAQAQCLQLGTPPVQAYTTRALGVE